MAKNNNQFLPSNTLGNKKIRILPSVQSTAPSTIYYYAKKRSGMKLMETKLNEYLEEFKDTFGFNWVKDLIYIDEYGERIFLNYLHLDKTFQLLINDSPMIMLHHFATFIRSLNFIEYKGYSLTYNQYRGDKSDTEIVI